jgi:heme exporter protein B
MSAREQVRPGSEVPARQRARPGVLRGVAWALGRDLRLAFRSRSELALQLLFFIIVITLFPLGVSPEPKLLSTMAPGVVWLAALLSALLSLGRLFHADYADGTLEQMALSPFPLVALVFGKILAHWLSSGVPLVVLSPLAGVQFGLAADEIGILVAALLLGTPILSFLGAVGSALTLGLRSGSSLLALLVLPLFVPVIVFGAGAVEAVRTGLSAEPHLSLLAAGMVLAAIGAPFATSAAVRIALD